MTPNPQTDDESENRFQTAARIDLDVVDEANDAAIPSLRPDLTHDGYPGRPDLREYDEVTVGDEYRVVVCGLETGGFEAVVVEAARFDGWTDAVGPRIVEDTKFCAVGHAVDAYRSDGGDE